jgi:hypothetical protein
MPIIRDHNRTAITHMGILMNEDFQKRATIMKVLDKKYGNHKSGRSKNKRESNM